LNQVLKAGPKRFSLSRQTVRQWVHMSFNGLSSSNSTVLGMRGTGWTSSTTSTSSLFGSLARLALSLSLERERVVLPLDRERVLRAGPRDRERRSRYRGRERDLDLERRADGLDRWTDLPRDGERRELRPRDGERRELLTGDGERRR
jgi:hypothetical protein